MEHGKSLSSIDGSRQGPGPNRRRDARSPVASTLGSHNEGTLFGWGSLKLADLGFYRDVFLMHVILELWGVSGGLARKDQFWTPLAKKCVCLTRRMQLGL